jgi:hypothetical protein
MLQCTIGADVYAFQRVHQLETFSRQVLVTYPFCFSYFPFVLYVENFHGVEQRKEFNIYRIAEYKTSPCCGLQHIPGVTINTLNTTLELFSESCVR